MIRRARVRVGQERWESGQVDRTRTHHRSNLNLGKRLCSSRMMIGRTAPTTKPYVTGLKTGDASRRLGPTRAYWMPAVYGRGGGSDGHQHARASKANAIGHDAPAVLYDLKASQKRKRRGRLSDHERSDEAAAPAHLEVLRGPHVGRVGLDAGQDIELGVDNPAHDAVCAGGEVACQHQQRAHCAGGSDQGDDVQLMGRPSMFAKIWMPMTSRGLMCM